VAFAPLGFEHLDRLAPDVIMFHPAHAVSLRLPPSLPEQPVVRVARSEVTTALVPGPLVGGNDVRNLASYSNDLYPVVAAALVLSHYLRERDQYEVVLSAYGNTYHVYGIRRTLESLPRILEAIESSHRAEHYHSYAALKRLPAARAPTEAWLTPRQAGNEHLP
jgi:hypothetical protein